MSSLAQVFRNLGGVLRPPGLSVAGPAERRVAPRVSKRLPVKVEGHALTSTNVSQSGLQVQVSCPETWLRSLRDRWDRNSVDVQIELPEGDIMAVECSVAYVSECDDEFLIGLKFNREEDARREPWQSYLARLYGRNDAAGTASAA